VTGLIGGVDVGPLRPGFTAKGSCSDLTSSATARRRQGRRWDGGRPYVALVDETAADLRGIAGYLIVRVIWLDFVVFWASKTAGGAGAKAATRTALRKIMVGPRGHLLGEGAARTSGIAGQVGLGWFVVAEGGRDGLLVLGHAPPRRLSILVGEGGDVGADPPPARRRRPSSTVGRELELVLDEQGGG